MGEWTAIISGHGINGGGTDKDADEQLKALVAKLQDGQEDVRGVFLYGFNALKTQSTSPGSSVSVGGTVSQDLTTT